MRVVVTAESVADAQQQHPPVSRGGAKALGGGGRRRNGNAPSAHVRDPRGVAAAHCHGLAHARHHWLEPAGPAGRRRGNRPAAPAGPVRAEAVQQAVERQRLRVELVQASHGRARAGPVEEAVDVPADHEAALRNRAAGTVPHGRAGQRRGEPRGDVAQLGQAWAVSRVGCQGLPEPVVARAVSGGARRRALAPDRRAPARPTEAGPSQARAERAGRGRGSPRAWPGRGNETSMACHIAGGRGAAACVSMSWAPSWNQRASAGRAGPGRAGRRARRPRAP